MKYHEAIERLEPQQKIYHRGWPTDCFFAREDKSKPIQRFGAMQNWATDLASENWCIGQQTPEERKAVIEAFYPVDTVGGPGLGAQPLEPIEPIEDRDHIVDEIARLIEPQAFHRTYLGDLRFSERRAVTDAQTIARAKAEEVFAYVRQIKAWPT